MQIEVKKHDNHNLDCQISFPTTQGVNSYFIDIYFFSPGHIGVKQNYGAELKRDFQSRWRLTQPKLHSRGHSAIQLELGGLGAACAKSDSDEFLSQCQTLMTLLSDEMFESVRRVELKPEEVISEVKNVNLIIQQVREVVVIAIGQFDKIKSWFEEFLSQSYVNYLHKIKPYIHYKDGGIEFWTVLIQGEEQYRQKMGFGFSSDSNDLEKEKRVLKFNYMKKFFQSRRYLDLQRKPVRRKIAEIAALLGTFSAGFAAASLQQWQTPAAEKYAWGGGAIFLIGVFLYVLRDRLKDWAIEIIRIRAEKFVPEFDSKIYAEKQEIGRIKEWFRIMGSKDLEPDIITERRELFFTEFESFLPEDVIHIRQEIILKDSQKSFFNEIQRPTILENMRVNINRYLKYLDDHEKDLIELDYNSDTVALSSHRAYPFGLMIKVNKKCLDEKSTETFSKKFRIMLDKRGLHRID